LLPVEIPVVLCFMAAVFAVASRMKRNDLADVAWGPGFIVIAFASAAATGGFSPRALLVTVLVCVWGARLALHISRRFRSKNEEDPRYRKWRENWGRHQLLGALLQVFLLQGLLMVVVSLPVIAAVRLAGPPLGPLDMFGAALWTFGFAFEVAGDSQFARFLADPSNRGRIMDRGLWRYTRHPNYFGEVVLWWGIYVIALSVPLGWLTVFGPLTITALILFVSGVPLAEAQMAGSGEYNDYRRRTSMFFPLPPKK
jgi:steroid 5-alpha reductase family enzyme